MKIYRWRKNFAASIVQNEQIVYGKLAFKTKETHWLETEKPVIILVSINSVFHERGKGDLKMNALLSIVKNHVKGPVTVLMSERAHLQVMSLKYENNPKKAFDECFRCAQLLYERYQCYFTECKVVYWHSYICEDDNFANSLEILKKLYQEDCQFRDLLYKDAESTYTIERSLHFFDKDLFIEKAIDDILEQCACMLVLAQKGYRFQFYPGQTFTSVEYANQILNAQEKRISWIDVFLTLEKKKILTDLQISPD
jgi:hypothetical protein